MFIDIILILNYINFVISEEIVFENNSDLNLFSDEKDIESEVFIIAPQAKRKINCSINEMYMGENKFNDYHHLPKETCVCANVAMVINPYKDLVPRKIFNSAYIQCAICLSMASQLQEWLAEFNIGLNNPKQEIEKIECAVNSFCKEGFSSLHLRNSFKHFKDIDKLLKYIYNEVEGNWSLLLNEKCNKYTLHINVVNFYNALLESPYSIAHLLCRNSGVFRDCVNVQLKNGNTRTKRNFKK